MLPLTRRQMLGQLAGGFGSVALAGMLNDSARADSVEGTRLPHFSPRAQRIIFLFMNGGPSQVDTFDPKPGLVKWEGKRLPVLEENTNKLLGKPRPLGNAFPTPWKFAKYGQSGIDVSELFPNVGRCVDDLCVIRSMCCDSFFHAQGTLEMMTGSGLFLRPSMGSWLLYGMVLGTENANLPGFVVLGDTMGNVDAVKVFGSAFLPAAYQSTRLEQHEGEPIPNLRPQKSLGEQRAILDLLKLLNEQHLALRARGEQARRPHPDFSSWPSACRPKPARPSTCPGKRRKLPGSMVSTTRRRPTMGRSACWPAVWPSAASAAWWSTTPTGTSTAAWSPGTRRTPPRSTGRLPACCRT